MFVPHGIGAPGRMNAAFNAAARRVCSNRAAALLLAACFVQASIEPARAQSLQSSVALSGERQISATSDIREQAIRLRRQGRLREAAELFRQELSSVEGEPRAGAARIAAAAHNLGEVNLRLGNYGEAGTLLLRAMKLWDAAGDDSSHPAATLFQLGHLRRLQGRYDEATEMLQRAGGHCQEECRAGREWVIGLAAWGDLYLAEGRLGEAEESYEQARRVVSQANDQAVEADIWRGLVMVHRRQARYREAERAARNSIKLTRESFGDAHTLVAVGLANLGLIQIFQRKYSAARKSLGEALERMERSAGSNSPDVAPILSNMALVNQQTGRVTAAESLLRRALAINTEAYGPEHPSVALSLASLGVLALQRGEPRAAEELLRKSLALTEKSLGHEHPETANVLVHLGLTLTAQGRPEQAFAVYERALSIRKRALGGEHPDVAVTLAHWAAALRAAGRGSDAAQLEERAREAHSARGPARAGSYTVDVETLLKESSARP